MYKKNHYLSNYFSVFIFTFLFLINNSIYSQFIESPLQTANSGTIENYSGTSNNILEIIDPDINCTSCLSINPKVFLSVQFDTDQLPFQHIIYTINLVITPLDASGNPLSSINKTLQIENNPHSTGGNFVDLRGHLIEDSHGANVVVSSFLTEYVNSGSSTTDTPENISLSGKFMVERYYTINTSAPNGLAHVETYTTDSGNNNVLNELEISWNSLAGALEYELEYTWIDNYSNEYQDFLNESQVPLTTRDFELNNTRISTKQTSFKIPLIYDSGFLIYRIRAVARNLDNITQNYYTNWSSGTGTENTVNDWPDKFNVNTAHESKMNWQFQSSFAEDGKKKEVVSYFDGSLRNRQTVTKINTDNNPIVGEVIYDNQGRPAIEVLPVPVNPVDGDAVKFYPDFNLNLSNEIYTHLDFDWGGEEDCDANADGMSNASGSSKYYGVKSASTDTFQDFVPDAQNFPFSQIQYTPDNTGRIRKKGGVGLTHQIGSNREMKYYYSVPTQEELNRLFGYRVGNVAHYKKNMVVDPNGQVSISYIDPQGRTIATALAGDKPTNLIGLDDENNASGLHQNVTTDLLNKINENDPDTEQDNNERYSTGNFGVNKDGLRVSRQVAVATDQTNLSFDYSADHNGSFVICSGDYPFVFDINATLTDDCATPIISNFNESQSLPFTDQYDSGPLTIGTYSYSKELTVNAQVLDNYVSDYLFNLTDPNGNCYVDPDQFAPDTSFLLCEELDCENWESYFDTQFGTQDDYIIASLKLFYDNNTFAIVNTPIENALDVSFNDLPDDINGEANIDDSEGGELDLMIQRFKREWELLYEAFELTCQNYVTSCFVSGSMLLQDVSPMGQYGTVLEEDQIVVTDPLSVFNEDNGIVFNNSTLNNNWRHPDPPYEDAFGNLSRITVSLISENIYEPSVLSGGQINEGQLSDGSTFFWIHPEDLEFVEDFFDAWDPNWAKSLLKYHPERCYLDYSEALCNQKAESINLDMMSSDEFDGFVLSVNSYDEAYTDGLLNSSDSEAIYKLDPYFDGELTGFENSTLLGFRRGIMLEALNVQYENFVIDLDNLNLIKYAYALTVCTGLNTCNVPSSNTALFSAISSLTTFQKDKLWNNYKSNYLSLKEKIKYVFLNIYAKEQGCYNGCIGGNDSTSLTTVLAAYTESNPSVLEGISDYITNNTALSQFCDHQNAPLYEDKQKRFVPADELYDSGIDPGEAIGNMEGDNDYLIWLQTGKCPLIFDFEIYLNGYFSEPVNPDRSNYTYSGQYLTPDLFEEFGGSIPDNNLSQTGTISGSSGNTLTFNTNGTTTVSDQIRIQSSGLNWNNYNYTGTSGWRIAGISQTYYDATSPDNDPENGVFAFQFKAQVINNGSFEEVIFTGIVHAAIGECGTDPNSVGQILDDQITEPDSPYGCTRRAKFYKDYIKLINKLKDLDELHASNYSLSLLPEYIDSFIPEFLEDDPQNTSAVWAYDGTTIYSINNVTNPVNLNVLDGLLNDSNILNFESIQYIDTPASNDIINLYFTDDDGSITFYEAIFSPGLNYSCCSEQVISEEVVRIGIVIEGTGGVYEPYRFKVAKAINDFMQNNVGSKLVLYINNTPNSDPLEIFNLETASSIPLPCASSCPQANHPEHCTPGAGGHGVPVGCETRNPKINNNNGSSLIYPTNKIFNQLNSENNSLDCLIIVASKDNSSISQIQSTYNQAMSLSNEYFFMLIDNNSYSSSNLSANNYVQSLISSTPLLYPNSTPSNILDFDYDLFDLSEAGTQDNFDQNSFSLKLLSNLEKILTEATGLNSQPISCEDCIPQTVAPVSCTEKHEQFTDPVTGIETIVTDYSLPEAFSVLDNFCSLNYAYLVDSYFYYLNTLNITSTNSDYFLSIAEFGDTNLNYGYNNIEDVIDAFHAYINVPTPVHFWQDFVNLDYMVNNDVCPPAFIPTGPINIEAPDGPCDELELIISETYEQDAIDNYINTLVEKFKRDYINTAMGEVIETLDMTYYDKEYQYTLYYYDQGGNLIQTVAPEGVNRLDITDANLNDQINQHRDDGQPTEILNLRPDHSFKTQYKYNSLNQLVWQNTPDGGQTKFAYDDLGRIIASQNANQNIYYQTIITDLNYVFEANVFLDTDGTIGKINTGWGNAGGKTVNTLEGDGFVSRVLVSEEVDDNKDVILGLSYPISSPGFANVRDRIHYGILTYDDNGTNKLTVYNQGSIVGLFSGVSDTFHAEDLLVVERNNGSINFYRNGELIQSLVESNPSLSMFAEFGLLNHKNKIAELSMVEYNSDNNEKELYSYTLYDDLGRIKEAGQYEPKSNDLYSISENGRLLYDDGNTVLPVNSFDFSRCVLTEITRTFYDSPILVNFLNNTYSNELFLDYTPFTSRNRVTAVVYIESIPSLSTHTGYLYDHAILYNYDIHGNVKELINIYPIINGDSFDNENHIKRVNYEYDLISGNVNKVIYQNDKPDQFIHRYDYDADNRIVKVETSSTGYVWENEAVYEYYHHGPLARVLIGDKKVQGLDYVYTLQGWLKNVNAEDLVDSTKDPGNDGNLQIGTSKDAFAYSLSYYNGDYLATFAPSYNAMSVTGTTGVPASQNELYNGNIKQMTTSLRELEDALKPSQVNLYEYDQLNRIKSMSSASVTLTGGTSVQNSYGANYGFDRNGNLQTLVRTVLDFDSNNNGNPITMDDFEYSYKTATNKLQIVKDNINTSNEIVDFETDLKDQHALLNSQYNTTYDESDEATHNYVYDRIGQLVKDRTEGLEISWRVDGKVKEILKAPFGSKTNSIIRFDYDGLGNRVAKRVSIEEQIHETITHYIRDAQGNVLGVYTIEKDNSDATSANIVLREHHIFGSSRLGMEQKSHLIFTNQGTLPTIDPYAKYVGDKR
ncbi:MAG: hypothetical protein COW66_14030, partial [Flavobacteriaceae bacterium CG18_big_fil_WC_8_21_14_2_50_34_36]